MKNNRPREQRFRVNLSVRYENAREFMVEYVENISTGGLFIRSAQNLEIGQEVGIELQLPGFDTFHIFAHVIHILTPEVAKLQKRNPGAGLKIIKTSKGFKEALHSYILLLGRRRDYIVFVKQQQLMWAITEAGFDAQSAPEAQDLLLSFSRVTKPVAGVVVPTHEFADYIQSASIISVSHLIKPINNEEELDSLLSTLDQHLIQFSSQ